MIREQILRKIDEQHRGYKEVFDRLEGVVDVTGEGNRVMKVKDYLECVLNREQSEPIEATDDNSSCSADEWVEESPHSAAPLLASDDVSPPLLVQRQSPVSSLGSVFTVFISFIACTLFLSYYVNISLE
eukprot:TRINITY_DN18953_c0_g1_i1.p1 TRINITY_DN18953_c0_g1~~TRINITY_DN18953_c0_g1_i1.p1  ORF type:complete len:129 (+),score=30.69 TRINITY_DN18953_c0_g1_i1:77-463(+)